MEYFAISNGIPVHILDTKKGDKTIMLLHGYLETLYIFNEFIEELEKKYRVIAIDLPGHGLTGSDKEVNSMEFCAKVAADVLQKSGVQKAYVAGHSMGGYVAQNCVKLFPELFQGVILLNSTPNADSPEKKSDREREIELVLSAKLGHLATLSIPKMYAQANLRKFDEKIEETIEITETHDPKGIVACIKGMMERADTKDVLKNAGSISNKQMENIVDRVYEEFNSRRKLFAAQQADKMDNDELSALEADIKNRKKD
jgi:pimeloyl-ACP methyl ester carboxylesterase